MTEPSPKKITYRDSGVDIDVADSLIRSLAPDFKRISQPGQVEVANGFAGLFEIPKGFSEPVLVSATDGVGTKLKIAFEMDKHETIGIDLVAMCVNDIAIYGVQPLYMLDYFATGKIDEKVAKIVIQGIIRGCEIAKLALIGGETAEMPDMYAVGEYDLAGFCVGIAEKSKIIYGNRVSEGDVILGLASSGVHSNGFSLIRKLIADKNIPLTAQIEKISLGDTLLTPATIYVEVIDAITKTNAVHALAHITGGGIRGNLERVVPSGFAARIDSDSWPKQSIFSWIQNLSALSEQEMFETFNCGIGMIAIVSSNFESEVRCQLDSLQMPNYKIGSIIRATHSTTVFE